MNGDLGKKKSPDWTAWKYLWYELEPQTKVIWDHLWIQIWPRNPYRWMSPTESEDDVPGDDARFDKLACIRLLNPVYSTVPLTNHWLLSTWVDSLVSITCVFSFSVSRHRLCFLYIDTRLSIRISVSRWSVPSTLLLVSTTSICISLASIHRSRPVYVHARLAIRVSVSGWFFPSILMLASKACTSNSSASFHRPWFRKVDAKLDMLISVSGCSGPKTLFLVSRTCTCNSSASFHRPWSL